MKTEFQSMRDRIFKCKTLEELKKVEVSIDRLFNNGIFTASQLQRLDSLICSHGDDLTNGLIAI